MYRIISSNRDSLTSSFPVCMPFINFPCLIALTKVSSTILNKNYLVSDLRGNAFSFPPFSVMMTMSLSYVAFIRLRCDFSIPNLFRALIMNRC
jgi:hypothetical protein